MTFPRRLAPAGYSAVLAVVSLGPLLGPGSLLLRDAVSTPRSFLTDTALGLSDAAPRSVPQDAMVAVLSSVVDGAIVVKAILFASLWLAGWGAAVAVRELLSVGLGAQLVATTVTCWNPYVAERLLQGHWSLFTGYAALPWIVVFGTRSKRVPGNSIGESTHEHTRREDGVESSRTLTRTPVTAALLFCLAAAALTPSGGILAIVVALVVVERSRRALVVAGILCWVPWLIPALVDTDGALSDPAGVPAFAARAEPGLSTLGALAGLGGIWNAQAVPGSRTSLFAVFGTIALLVVVVPGLVILVRRRKQIPLIALTVAAVLLPALAATPPGLALGQWLVGLIPGAGLLRDTQKYLALAIPGYALGAAATTQWARRWSPMTAPILAVLTIAVLPDLAFGVGGNLRPVHYPGSWRRVAEVLRLTHTQGEVAVLPGGMFRKFRYSGTAPVLDPAPRMLPVDVLQTGTLVVHGRSVFGEGQRARDVEALLLHGASARKLAEAGVGSVLVERTSPGPLGNSAATLAQLRRVYADSELALYRIPEPIAVRPTPARWQAICAHLLWATLLLGSALFTTTPRVRHQLRRFRSGRTRSATT